MDKLLASYGYTPSQAAMDLLYPGLKKDEQAPTDDQIASLYDIPPKKENEGNDGGT